MMSTTTTTAALVTLAAASLASSATLPSPPTFHPRSLHTHPSTLSSSVYDYIVVGGGLAGLVVANRLSANPNISVAVIEAGSSGYGDDSKFTVPAANLYDSAVGTAYDWRWTTSAQAGLAGRSAAWPRGKVLGGSSAINGLYYVRHSEVEQEAWAELNGAEEDEWGWRVMLDAMKKSETFTPADGIGFDVPYNASSHGTHGPVHVSYPAMSYPQVPAFLQSTANVGIAASTDPDAGQSWGAFLATSNINPSNYTRSFSRTAYYDPITYRSNLDVLTDHLVTKITFNSTGTPAVANGVQFAQYSGAQVHQVYARKEVILCGGAVNDPQILQLSGVGDSALLERVGVDVVVDLPGVGYHLQDHLSTGVVWSPSGQAQAAMPPTSVTGNATVDSYVNSAIAYVSGSTIFGPAEWSSLIGTMKAARDGSVEAYDAPAAVKRGYNATYGVQVDKLFPSDIGPVELLFALSFGGVQVQAALQHPLSRGSITVNSTDPFSAPVIDPAYLSHETDMVVLREGFKLARKVGQAAPLSNYVGAENAPGRGVQTDAQWENWIRSTVGTEFHPSSTCSMLPREWGGVVGKDLKVYGVQNVRVVDASVPPVSFSAHLMSVVYGLAERGSEMVLQDWERGMAGEGTNTSAATSGGGRGGGGSGSGSGSRGASGAGRGTAGTSGESSAAEAGVRVSTTVVAVVSVVAAVLVSL